MTLKEAKNELIKKNNQLEYWLKIKNIEFTKTGYKSMTLKDIVVQGGLFGDKINQCIIRSEKYDEKIYPLLEEINALEKYLINEYNRLRKYDMTSLINYLRDEEKTTWEDISKITNYSIRQCHRLYDEAKK